MRTRLVSYAPLGARTGVLPDALSTQIVTPLGEMPTLNIHYHRDGVNATKLDGLTEVAFEYHNGTTWVEPPNCRFLSLRGSFDHLEATPTRKYDMVGLGDWMLRKAKVWEAGGLPVDADGKVQFSSANAGTIIKTLFDKAKARGWGAGLSIDFTGTATSDAQPWANIITIAYSMEQDLESVLNNLYLQGLCDYRWEGRTLRLFNADTAMGRDLTTGAGAVRLLTSDGQNSAPEEWTNEDLVTDALLVGDENARWQKSNGPHSILGRLEHVILQGGVSLESTALLLVDHELAQGATTRSAYTREFDVTEDSSAVPYKDYLPGDWVLTQKDGAMVPLRTYSISLTTADSSGVRGHAVLGDRLDDMVSKIAKRTRGITNGSSAGGSGVRPAPEGPDKRTPSTPTGFTVSPAVYINSFGVPQGRLDIDWLHDGKATDGTVMDLVRFEVMVGVSFSGKYHISRTVDPSQTDLSLDGLPHRKSNGTLEQYAVKVRAVGDNGKASAWTTAIDALMVPDTTPPNTPSNGTVTVERAVFTYTHDGKDEFGADQPTDFARIDVEMGTSSTGPWTRMQMLGGAGSVVVANQGYVTRWFRARAFDTSGNASGYSTPVSATAVPLVQEQDIADEINRLDGVDTAQAADITAAQTAASNAQTAAADAASDAAAAQTTASNAATAAANAATAAADAQADADAAKAAAEQAMLSAVNVVADPSFETTPSPHTLPSRFSVVSTEHRSGAKALQVVAGTQQSWFATDKVPIKAGDVWVFTVYAKTTPDYNGTAGNGKIRIANQSGSLVTATTFQNVGAWTKHTARVAVPEGWTHTHLQMQISCDHSAGTLWLDDMSMQEVSEAEALAAAAAAAQTAADDAQADATAAAGAAAAAQTDATQALADAATAQSAANAAQTAADNAQTAANNAMTTASGKNKITRSTSAPSGNGLTTGDIHERYSTLATGGKLLESWSWNGSAWVVTELDETYLPLVNIGSGTYGILNGLRIGARTITTDSMIVSDMQNLVDNGEFIYSNASGEVLQAQPGTYRWAEGGLLTPSIVADTACRSGFAARLSTSNTSTSYYEHAAVFPAKPGEKFRVKYQYKKEQTTLRGLVRVDFYDASMALIGSQSVSPDAGVVTSTTVFYDVTGEVEAMANTAFARVVVHSGISGVATTYRSRISGVEVFRMNAGELVVDGGIKAKHLDVEDIDASGRIKSNAFEGDEYTGGTFTGGVFQTHTSPNQGVKITPAGFETYDAEGTKTVQITPGQGVDFMGFFGANLPKDHVVLDGWRYALVTAENYVFFMPRVDMDPTPFSVGDTVTFTFKAKADVAQLVYASVWTYPVLEHEGTTGVVTNSSTQFSIGTTENTYSVTVPISSLSSPHVSWTCGLRHASGFAGTELQENIAVKDMQMWINGVAYDISFREQLAGINSRGQGSFQEMAVRGDAHFDGGLVMGGEALHTNAYGLETPGDLGPVILGRSTIGTGIQTHLDNQGSSQTSWLDAVPHGIITRAYKNSSGLSCLNQEKEILELEYDALTGRAYMVNISPMTMSVGTGTYGYIRVYWTNDGSRPTMASNVFYQWTIRNNANATMWGVLGGDVLDDLSTARKVRLLVTMGGEGPSTAALWGTIYGGSCRVNVMDIGLYASTATVDRTGVRATGGAAPAPTGTTVPTKTTYQKTFSYSWSEKYKGDNSINTYSGYSGKAVQGYSIYAPSMGRMKSLVGFPSMASTLSGAEVVKIEVYCYAEHWYSNAGGTLCIGTHSNASRPGTFTDGSGSPNLVRQKMRKPEGRWITLPSSTHAGFKAGTLRGISVTAPTNSSEYYGYLRASATKLRVTYKK